MLKGIAYIGYGFVGKACHEQFRHNVPAIIIDPKHAPSSTIQDLKAYEPEVAFVSINAPTLQDRSVDDSVIHKIFAELEEIQYKGIVVLKSTLPPLQVQALADKYGASLKFIYCPEFLREAKWQEDALRPSQMIFAGHQSSCLDLKVIYQRHSHVWSACNYIVGTNYVDAALVKYSINSFLAMKVAFMNEIYELMCDLDVELGQNPVKGFQNPEMWNHFTEMLGYDSRIGRSHLQVPGPDGNFGYGGSCFPKDVSAMIGFDKNERMSLLRDAELANTKHRLKGKL